MSQQTGKVQEAARVDPLGVEDPMDGSVVSDIISQALEEVARLGQQGAATEKALLLAMGAAAKIGQLTKEEAKRRAKPKTEKRQM